MKEPPEPDSATLFPFAEIGSHGQLICKEATSLTVLDTNFTTLLNIKCCQKKHITVCLLGVVEFTL